MNDQLETFWQFISLQSDKLIQQTITHIGLTFISLLLAILIGLPLGILIAKKTKLAGPVLSLAGILQTIPSIALLGFMIPVLGIGAKPAIAALFLYGLLPIIRNTFTGISGTDPDVIESAKGMGMNNMQVLLKIELPLAMPVILAGIRTATVINVGVATLAAYIAAGGLGEFIFGGIALNNTHMILAGAIPAAILAVLFDYLLSKVQRLSFKKLRVSLWFLPLSVLLLASCFFIPQTTGSKLLAGFTPEFMGRTDGYIGLVNQYGLKIRTLVLSDALMYKAVYDKKLDVISGYSTDGRLKAYNLVVLQDDKRIFPPYYAAPIVRDDALKKFPHLEKTLNLIAGKINDSIMTELNYRTDYLKENPEKVARDFLIAQGLWKPPQPAGGEYKQAVRIGSKIFGEQYILTSIYGMLIRAYTNYPVETKTGLGGTKICFDALLNDQIDLYPEYTGTGLLVILHPPQKTVEKLITDKNLVYDYVSYEFNRQFGIRWLKPIGFNNAYALMMRQKQSEELQVRTISDLQKYLQNKM